MKTPVLETVGLSHKFADGTLAIENIDLVIEQGQMVVIAGANGSGKTTLLRHFNGLLRPTAGKVLVDGIEAGKDLMRTRKIVQMVFQDTDSQIVGETVWDEVAFGPENLGWPAKEIRSMVEQALVATGLERFEHVSPHLLSGGQKRRLTIAGVLAMAPRVLVLDEPFSNLDFQGIKMVLDKVLELHRNKMTVIISTHELDKIAAHAQRLLVLSKGRIVADGPVEQVVPGIEDFGVCPPCSLKCKGFLTPWPN